MRVSSRGSSQKVALKLISKAQFVPFGASGQDRSSRPRPLRSDTQAPSSSHGDARYANTVSFGAATGTEEGHICSQKRGEKKRKEKGKASNNKGRVGRGQAQRSPQQHLTSPCLDVMGLMQGQDWALCDKDCGWCGRCAGDCGYQGIQTDQCCSASLCL